MKTSVKKSLYAFAVLVFSFTGCSGISGPDKTAEGTLLAAAWGAGAGAVIGNQTGSLGPGAAVGAAFGAGIGLLTGLGLDVQEGFNIDQQREIDSLEILVDSNQRELRRIQAQLDDRQRVLLHSPSGTIIYFDEGRASLHIGSALELERLANAIRLNPYVGSIQIYGHSEDFGDAEKNNKLAEARAQTVATFLTEHGVSSHLLKVESFGATKPITSNKTVDGKHLNRRVEIVLLK